MKHLYNIYTCSYKTFFQIFPVTGHWYENPFFFSLGPWPLARCEVLLPFAVLLCDWWTSPAVLLCDLAVFGGDLWTKPLRWGLLLASWMWNRVILQKIYIIIKWGSEYWTCPVFGWSTVVLILCLYQHNKKAAKDNELNSNVKRSLWEQRKVFSARIKIM